MEKKQPKVIVTFRSRHAPPLKAFAKKEVRTVSNVVGIAVKEFIERQEAKHDGFDVMNPS